MGRDVTDEQRGRRAYFHRNPSGRSQLAVFLRCSLGPYDSDIGARSRLEKQPTDFRQNICYFGDRTLALRTTDRAGCPCIRRSSGSKRKDAQLTRICITMDNLFFLKKTKKRMIIGEIRLKMGAVLCWPRISILRGSLKNR
jgi:hypothetical protein